MFLILKSFSHQTYYFGFWGDLKIGQKFTEIVGDASKKKFSRTCGFLA